MKKYSPSCEITETILQLMCGEEQEDGCKPTRDEIIEAMRNTNKLVEKEMPTKPIIGIFEYHNDVEYVCEWKCPRCGGEFRTQTEVYNYRPNCGQHIDRSEIERSDEDKRY